MNYDVQTRYARQISLPQIGEAGQDALMAARVLVVGAGGLAAPLLAYLAGAGIGTIGVVDDDRVALSNLPRQTLFETADVGMPKVEAAKDALYGINPGVTIVAYNTRLMAGNADALFAEYDLIADASDNFETRFLVNQQAFQHGKTLVSAAVIGWQGQLSSFKAHLGAPHPCYQCFCPELPPPDATPRCADAGVMGSVVGQLGAMQATEVIKEILGIGESLSGSMIIIDALAATTRKVSIVRAVACHCCGV